METHFFFFRPLLRFPHRQHFLFRHLRWLKSTPSFSFGISCNLAHPEEVACLESAAHCLLLSLHLVFASDLGCSVPYASSKRGTGKGALLPSPALKVQSLRASSRLRTSLSPRHLEPCTHILSRSLISHQTSYNYFRYILLPKPTRLPYARLRGKASLFHSSAISPKYAQATVFEASISPVFA